MDRSPTTSYTVRSAVRLGIKVKVGHADGAPFDAAEFLRIHPQWNWQEGYLLSRPSQPWARFSGDQT